MKKHHLLHVFCLQVLNSKYEYLCDWNTEVLSACKLCPLDVHRVNDQVLAAVIEGHVILYQCPDVEGRIKKNNITR